MSYEQHEQHEHEQHAHEHEHDAHAHHHHNVMHASFAPLHSVHQHATSPRHVAAAAAAAAAAAVQQHGASMPQPSRRLGQDDEDDEEEEEEEEDDDHILHPNEPLMRKQSKPLRERILKPFGESKDSTKRERVQRVWQVLQHETSTGEDPEIAEVLSYMFTRTQRGKRVLLQLVQNVRPLRVAFEGIRTGLRKSKLSRKRQWMSLVTGFSREDAKKVLGVNFNNTTFHNAKRHAEQLGPGAPRPPERERYVPQDIDIPFAHDDLHMDANQPRQKKPRLTGAHPVTVDDVDVPEYSKEHDGNSSSGGGGSSSSAAAAAASSSSSSALYLGGN